MIGRVLGSLRSQGCGSFPYRRPQAGFDAARQAAEPSPGGMLGCVVLCFWGGGSGSYALLSLCHGGLVEAALALIMSVLFFAAALVLWELEGLGAIGSEALAHLERAARRR